MNGQESGNPDAFHEELAQAVARRFWRDHRYVNIGWRLDAVEADVESVSKHQGLAGAQIRKNGFFVNLLLAFVGNQHHEEVGGLDRLWNGGHLQIFGPRAVRRRAAGIACDNDFNAAVPKIEGVGVALAAIADDCHLLSAQ